MYQCIQTLVLSCLLLCYTLVHAANIEKFEQDISDSMITTKITAKITKKANLNPLKITVTTDHGVVTISGHVPDKQAYVDALRLAKSTKGVKSVKANKLYIKQVNTSFTDAYITAKVETALLKAKVLDDESIPLVGINATTNNGIVTLTGDLKSLESIQFILKRVKNIHGVKQVISHLHVKKDKA